MRPTPARSAAELLVTVTARRGAPAVCARDTADTTWDLPAGVAWPGHGKAVARLVDNPKGSPFAVYHHVTACPMAQASRTSNLLTGAREWQRGRIAQHEAPTARR